MTITLYGKPNCPKCEAAKKKLVLMQIPFDFVDVSEYTVFRQHPLVRDMKVEQAMRDKDELLPMILIEGKWYDYPEAMAELKRLGH